MSRPITRRLLRAGTASAVLLAVTLAALWAKTARRSPATHDAEGVLLASVEPELFAVRGGIFMLVGAGGNIVVQVGEEGVLIVDTQYAALGPKNLAAIRSVTAAPIRYVINTHAHSDHVGGNAFFRGYDSAGNERRDDSGGEHAELQIIAHESVPADLRAARFGSAWAPSELYSRTKEIVFNGESVALLHQPAAHTRGDTVVDFRNAGVIAAGDIYNGVIYPLIDRWKGGTVQGLLAALDRLVDLTASYRDRGIEPLVIPGHGEMAGADEVAAYRDMAALIVERIETMIAAGMSLEQIQAAQPTLEYDERYGHGSRNWTSADFVAAVHHDLTK